MSGSAPSHADPRSLRDRAVACMNRGHEFLLRDDPPSLQRALEAYNEAIALFRAAPALQDPAWTNSFAAALMNRGHLRHRLSGLSEAAAALVDFDEAIALLRAIPPGESPWPRRNLAGSLVNRANLLLDLARFDEALLSAQQALLAVAPGEREFAIDADLALKSRRAAGDALGRLLVAPGADQDFFARQASDVVDDALALIRHWSGQPGVSFRHLALRFYRYGTQLYRYHQPHFLAEFLAEGLEPGDADFVAIALEAIDGVLAESQASGRILTIGDPASERRRQTWQDLAALRAKLAAT